MAWNDEPGTATQQPTEEQEFDRLFALDDPDSDTEANQGSTAAPPAKAAGDEGQDSGGQGAPGAGEGQSGDQSNEQPGATGTTTEQQAEDDWLAAAELPDEVKDRIRQDRAARDEAIKQADLRFKELHGKVAPTQRALADAQRQLAQRTAAPQQQPAPAAKTTQQASEDADFYESPAFKEYERMFPDDAKVLRGAIDARTGALQSSLQKMEERLGQISQQVEANSQFATTTAITAEREKLAQTHPDWSEFNASDEFWAWWENEWRTAQPKALRDTYYDQARLDAMWNDAEFIGQMIDEYKATHAAATGATTATTTQTESTTQQPVKAAPAQSARVAMAAQPQVRSTALPQAQSLEGLSEAEQFEQLWKAEG